MNLTGQKVAVLGAGRSGGAAARLALHLGAEVTVYDAAGGEAFGGVPDGATRCPESTVATGAGCTAAPRGGGVSKTFTPTMLFMLLLLLCAVAPCQPAIRTGSADAPSGTIESATDSESRA